MGGCGGDDDEPRRPGAATRTELQWVEAYATPTAARAGAPSCSTWRSACRRSRTRPSTCAAPGLSEAEVECAALQEVRRTARALGATQAYANRLADFVWEQIYPKNSPEYFTRACRDGGPLDVNSESSVWP
jgi:hypothetical protein